MVLKNSRSIIVTTETTKELYVDKYNIPKDFVHVVPMGFDPLDFNKDPLKKYNDNIVTFLYTGRIEPESRDAGNFFIALKELLNRDLLKNTRFEFVGSFNQELIDKATSLGLGSILFFYDWVTHKECMDKLVGADYLMLFGNNNNIQVPGKLFNYIGSGTPIIYFSNEVYPVDLVFDYLTTSGTRYFVVNNEVLDIMNVIQKLSICKKKYINNKLNSEHDWFSRARIISNLLKKYITE